MARKQGTEVTPAPATPDAPPALRRRSATGHELRASAPTAEPEEIKNRAHEVRFDLTCDSAYHAIREQFFARLNRFLTGVQVLLGTSAVAAMVGEVAGGVVWLVATSALAGVLLLVVDPAGAAREHRAFRTRIQTIRAILEEVGDSEESLRSARASLFRIAGEAPPAFRGISALAYNTATNAIYPEEAAAKHRYKVGAFRRLASNWLPMRGMQFKKEMPAGVDEPGKPADG
jgi:hypothetical protein